MKESKGDTSKSQTGIAGLDAIVAVKLAPDLGVVEIQFVDAQGVNGALRLGRLSVIDLIVHLVDALMVLEGKLGASERICEAQLLLRALVGSGRRKAHWVAQHLGVADSTISLWRSGKTIPTAARLDQLRQLVRSTVLPG